MSLKTGEQQVCFGCHFSAGIKDLQAMESEHEIRMSQLHEQLLLLQIGHQTASSHGAEDRHSKKQVCCRPGHFSAGMKSLWSTRTGMHDGPLAIKSAIPNTWLRA